MKKLLRSTATAGPALAACLATLLSLGGCAGGWRNGAPPGASESAPASATEPMTTRGASPSASGVTFTYNGGSNSVNLAGEFNGWNTTADPLQKQADGTWALTKKLEPGRYTYKFFIDGGTWKEDPAAKESVDDGYGGKNSVIVVGGATAPGTGAAMATSPSTPGTAGPTGKSRPPLVNGSGVTFSFAGTAQSVHLAGDFNTWSTTADPLTKQADGTWTITKKLAAGVYGYKFVINGTTWKTDEANTEGKDDGFGGKNSVVTVP